MPVTPEDLKVGYYVKFIGDEEWNGRLFRLKRHEYAFYKTGDYEAEFTAVASGSNSEYVTIDALEPDELELHFYRYGVRMGGRWRMKLKTGTSRLGPSKDKDVGYFDNIISPRFAMSDRLGIWLVEDYIPTIRWDNDTPVAGTPEVFFEGDKLDLEEITDTSKKQSIEQSGKVTEITLGGVQ